VKRKMNLRLPLNAVNAEFFTRALCHGAMCSLCAWGFVLSRTRHHGIILQGIVGCGIHLQVGPTCLDEHPNLLPECAVHSCKNHGVRHCDCVWRIVKHERFIYILWYVRSSSSWFYYVATNWLRTSRWRSMPTQILIQPFIRV